MKNDLQQQSEAVEPPIYCVKCESENSADAAFCSGCGWALKEIPVTDPRPEKRQGGWSTGDAAGWHMFGDFVSFWLFLASPIIGIGGCVGLAGDQVVGANLMAVSVLLGIMLFVLRILLLLRRRL